MPNNHNESLEKVVQNLIQNCELAIKSYENYLLDKTDWKDLARIMKRVRSCVSEYYAAGGKSFFYLTDRIFGVYCCYED